MNINKTQGKPKLDSLTSLRFVAAMLIILGHGHPYFGSFGLATRFSLAQGVSFFFVLSGYILAYNYPRLQDLSTIRKFYRARLARVWPLHVAGILIFFLLTKSFNTGTLHGPAQLVFAAVSNLFLVQSIIPLRDVYLVFNGVAWSLSTELFFYLVFPLLVAGRGARFLSAQLLLPLFLLCAFLLYCAGWNIVSDESFSGVSLMGLLYVNPMARLFEFSIGVAACRIFYSIKSRFPPVGISYIYSSLELMSIGLSLFSMYLSPKLISLFDFGGHSATVISYYLAKSGSAIAFGCMILIFSFGGGVVSRLLSTRLFLLLGKISFALYIVHMSVLQWYLQHLGIFSEIQPLIRLGFYWCICILLAYLSHKAIEEPMRHVLLGKIVNNGTFANVWKNQAFRAGFVLIVVLVFLRMIGPA